jgi:hypothetical protein
LAPRPRAPLDDDNPLIVTLDPACPMDLRTVDQLARLALVERRRGRAVQLRGAHSELRELIALLGLDGVLECAGGLPVEAGG